MTKRMKSNSGIYIFTNKINNKKYVGQSVNIDSRIKRHRKSSAIDMAIKKYKLSNFSIEKILCDEKDLDSLEIELIKNFNSLVPNGYNKSRGGQDNKHHLTEDEKINLSLKLKGVKKSETARLAMKEGHADFSGEKNPMYNKKQSEEAKNKIGEGNKDKVFSNEAHSKMSGSAKARDKTSTRDEKGRYCKKPTTKPETKDYIAQTPGYKPKWTGHAEVEVEISE
jgi:group I intron endonuclease